jgi:hypothetical protein
MEDFLTSLPKCQVQVDGNIVDATTGFAACEFAESVEADLLVLPGYNPPQGRVPPPADWALQVVPCSLWIVQGGAARPVAIRRRYNNDFSERLTRGVSRG